MNSISDLGNTTRLERGAETSRGGNTQRPYKSLPSNWPLSPMKSARRSRPEWPCPLKAKALVPCPSAEIIAGSVKNNLIANAKVQDLRSPCYRNWTSVTIIDVCLISIQPDLNNQDSQIRITIVSKCVRKRVTELVHVVQVLVG
jgi:hypothetical protein